jgi:hypothetical protein
VIKNGQPENVFILCYGGEEVPFRVIYRNRTQLSVSVLPDKQVEVIAPEGKAIDQVLASVDRRAAWIAKQRRYFDQFQPKLPGPRYVSGETHLFLGRQYRLKVREETPQTVKLVGRFLHVQAADRDDTNLVRGLVEDWYRTHGRAIFAHRLELCLASAKSLELSAPNLVVRKMVKRWGSCTKAGNILLNTDLVKVPVHCIDYVIMHELCHLKIHNHGKEFYRLLARCMPDWEKRKKRLDSFVIWQ